MSTTTTTGPHPQARVEKGAVFFHRKTEGHHDIAAQGLCNLVHHGNMDSHLDRQRKRRESRGRTP
eukprot:5265916-Amphidinium_carterae.1